MTNTKFNDLWHGSMLAALTACMAVGLASVAHAATPEAAPSVAVSYADLDLASATGMNTFYARVSTAAHQVCAPGSVDVRDPVERACVNHAITNAVRQVHDTRVASSLAARHDQG